MILKAVSSSWLLHENSGLKLDYKLFVYKAVMKLV